jgi:hypothetical protein
LTKLKSQQKLHLCGVAFDLLICNSDYVSNDNGDEAEYKHCRKYRINRERKNKEPAERVPLAVIGSQMIGKNHCADPAPSDKENPKSGTTPAVFQES